jgi:hypothetical protein
MIKKILLYVFLIFFLTSAAKKTGGVLDRMYGFHQILVEKPDDSVLDQYLHNDLSYGHSNGWIENRKEFREHLTTKYIEYHSFKEDSIHVVQGGKIAYIRFIGDIDATLNGKRLNFHLKVLEVWVKKNDWQLLARQAVKG